MDTGHRIKARRKKLGLSVDDLALATGKDRTTIFRYEKGTIDTSTIKFYNRNRNGCFRGD